MSSKAMNAARAITKTRKQRFSCGKSCAPLLRKPAHDPLRAQPAPAESLQGADERFKSAGNFVGGSAKWKADWGANAHSDFTEMGEAAVFALHLPDAVEPHRHDG